MAFGWYYPPGVKASDIDRAWEAADEDDDDECECGHDRLDHGKCGTWCAFPDCRCQSFTLARYEPDPDEERDDHGAD